jgi:hypothetical protein
MSVFVFYIILNILVLVIFFKFLKQRIYPLEIFVYWCLGSLIVQNYSAIQTMNYKTSIVLHAISLGSAHLLNRTILYPVITLMFLSTYGATKAVLGKIILILCSVILLTGMELLSNLLGVFVRVTWPIWLSASFWLVYVLIMIVFMKYFQRKLVLVGAQ